MHPIKSSILKTHMKMYQNKKLNKCNQCNFASSNRINLLAHQKIHVGQKSNTCNHCIVSILQQVQATWGATWKHTLRKSHKNVTGATIPHIGRTVWRLIWRFTVGKSLTAATNAIIVPLKQPRWIHANTFGRKTKQMLSVQLRILPGSES